MPQWQNPYTGATGGQGDPLPPQGGGNQINEGRDGQMIAKPAISFLDPNVLKRLDLGPAPFYGRNPFGRRSGGPHRMPPPWMRGRGGRGGGVPPWLRGGGKPPVDWDKIMTMGPEGPGIGGNHGYDGSGILGPWIPGWQEMVNKRQGEPPVYGGKTKEGFRPHFDADNDGQ